jgi:hypothetical protein
LVAPEQFWGSMANPSCAFLALGMLHDMSAVLCGGEARSGHPGVGSAACTVFVWLISHQPVVFLSQNKPATSNQPTVLFSHNKSAPAISHQPNEQADSKARDGSPRSCLTSKRGQGPIFGEPALSSFVRKLPSAPLRPFPPPPVRLRRPRRSATGEGPCLLAVA